MTGRNKAIELFQRGLTIQEVAERTGLSESTLRKYRSEALRDIVAPREGRVSRNQRRTIVIDRNRTPNAYDEFTRYEYDRDKDGNIISGYPDGNDHAISAVRYAFESLFNRRGNSA